MPNGSSDVVNTFPAMGGHDKNPVYPPVKNIKDKFPVTSIRSAVHDNPLQKIQKKIEERNIEKKIRKKNPRKLGLQI